MTLYYSFSAPVPLLYPPWRLPEPDPHMPHPFPSSWTNSSSHPSQPIHPDSYLKELISGVPPHPTGINLSFKSATRCCLPVTPQPTFQSLTRSPTWVSSDFIRTRKTLPVTWLIILCISLAWNYYHRLPKLPSSLWSKDDGYVDPSVCVTYYQNPPYNFSTPNTPLWVYPHTPLGKNYQTYNLGIKFGLAGVNVLESPLHTKSTL